MRTSYDVIIVGAGPAGIFAALELAGTAGLRVLMLEKGKDLDQRMRPPGRLRDGTARAGAQRAKVPPGCLVSGWGGAGAYSDGKLTLSPHFGGQLGDYVSSPALEQLIEEVDQTYLRFGAPTEVHGTEEEGIRELARRATLADLELIPARIRHLGTERCPVILQAMHRELEGKVGIRTETAAEEILSRQGEVTGVRIAGGKRLSCRYLIVAPGRDGAAWLTHQADRLGLKRRDNPVDVGVRVEVPAVTLQRITDLIYEPKLVFYSKTFDDRVRTFCMCPYGEVVTEYYDDNVITVNGHSYASKRTDKTNFALLVSTSFTEPFRDPIAYGKYLAGLANVLGGGVIVQRLGDLHAGRRSTHERIRRGIVQPTLASATPGDLSFVLPYRYLSGILEMLQALDQVAPGVASRHTLLYGVEVKFYSSRPKLSGSLETEVANLFAIGDGAGVTRGLVQASASGMLAAREILRRERQISS